MGFLLLFSFAALALSSPVVQQRVAAPSVTIKNGTVIGLSLAGVDSFKGIPFAQPPVGPLRLKPPQSITANYGTITAVGIPTACPQFYQQVDTSDIPADVVGQLLDSPFVQQATVTGEDCLTLNVQRPSAATSSSKLPVVFWIYGGGFEFGSTQTYDGSNFVLKSVFLGQPVIYVAVNYRVSGFGFLGGKELQKEGSTNLGLRDQRLGLQWVQDNIAAFGGDPTKVTIWGESAGAISILDQMLINNGDNSYNGGKLFRGAIMDSGSVIPAEDVASARPQAIFDQVVSVAGCGASANKLACLRSVPYATLLNAVNSVPAIFGYRSVDLSYLPRPDNASSFFSTSPEIPVINGAYTKVPIIIGDQQDEGTLFALMQRNISTTAQLTDYITSFFTHAPHAEIVDLVALYPDDPSAGSPFNTGPLYNLYPQYKRLAAILGDVVFTLARRTYLANVASKVPAWSYLSTYLAGTPVLGTFHASDILEVYDNTPFPLPAAAIQTYYISFINSLDPNSLSTPVPRTHWPQWTSATRQLMNFQSVLNVLITDDFREAAYEFLASRPSVFRS